MNTSSTGDHLTYSAMASEHYENFPVASWLLPASLRSAVATIYAFARKADDFADEGELEATERIALLEDYRCKLDTMQQGKPVDDPLFQNLASIINHHELPWQAFYDLLSAFTQDVSKHRYHNYAELLDYCSRSANPVGLLLLHLVNHATPELVEKSNAICSALQIINFLQDIVVDYDKGRIYLPLDEFDKFSVTETHIQNRQFDQHWQALIEFQLDRVQTLMLSGADLPNALHGRMKYEIRATVASGLHVIKLLRQRNQTGFSNQPRLQARDWVKIAIRTLIYPYS